MNAFDTTGQGADWENDTGPACRSVINHDTNSDISKTCDNEIREYASAAEYQSSHCFPYLAYPTDYLRLQSAWKKCVIQPVDIIYDPPKPLTSEFALVPMTPKAPGLTGRIGGASPASSTSLTIPSQTAPPLMFLPKSGSSLSTSGSSDPSSIDPSYTNSGAAGAHTTWLSISGPSVMDPSGDGLGSGDPSIERPDGDDLNSGSKRTTDSGNEDPGNGSPRTAETSNSHSNNGGSAKPADSQPKHAYSETAPSSLVTVANSIPNRIPTFTISIPSKISLSGTIIDRGSNFLVGSTVEAGSSVVQIFGYQGSIDPAAPKTAIDAESHLSPVPNNLLATRPLIVTTGGQILTQSSDRLLPARSTVSYNKPGQTREEMAVTLATSGLYIGEPAISHIAPNSQGTGFAETVAKGAVAVVANGSAIDGVTFGTRGQLSTIGGTLISLGASDISTTIQVPKMIAISTAGTTLVSDKPGITMEETLVSLRPNGMIFGGSTRASSSINTSLPLEIDRLVCSNSDGNLHLPSATGSTNPSSAAPASSAAVFQGRSSLLIVPWRTLVMIPLVMLAIRLGGTAF